MHILLWGTYDAGKPRARILRDGLRAVGIQLYEIHSPVWEGIEDKSQVKTLKSRLRLLLRWLVAYPRLIWRLILEPKPDLILIGYPGILDVLIASLVGRFRRVPVVWDVFISLYDTIVEDRRLLRPGSALARCLYWFERCALRLPSLIFMDTQTHARRLELLFSLPSGCCGAVWVGVEIEHFGVSTETLPERDGRPLRVLFYGQFIPLQGTATIIDAARILCDAPIEWTLIGGGQEAPMVRARLEAAPLTQLHWIDWESYDRLQGWIKESDLCLGIFGTSHKAASVIPNKVFQIVAAGRPLVTRDSPAIRELLQPTPGCVYLIPPGDPVALAHTVRTFAAKCLDEANTRCHQDLWKRIDAPAVGAQFLEMLQHKLNRN